MFRRTFLLLLLLGSCTRHIAGVSEVTVDQVAQWMKANQATVFDANSDEFRKANGTIAGSVALSHYRSFDLKELGEDKARQLVFYCSGRL